MGWRGKRTVPTVTELSRLERVLEGDLALRPFLGPKTSAARRRDGTVVYFAEMTMSLAQELMARRLSPERAPVGKVLGAVLDVIRREGPDKYPTYAAIRNWLRFA